MQLPRPGGDALVFASYNIHKCVGLDRRFDPERVAAVIAELGADVLALQEADRRFGERAGLLDFGVIARTTGLEPVEVPGRHGGHGWHGNVILARAGLVKAARSLRLPGLEPRGAVVADLDLAQGPVRVVAAHLGLLRHSRLLQAQAILAAAEREAERPTVLMGDFNEWRRARRSALHSFAPLFGPVGTGVPSFPAWFPVLALDRIMARPDRIIEGLEVHLSPLARIASDHLPIRARLRLALAEAEAVEAAAPAPEPSAKRGWPRRRRSI